MTISATIIADSISPSSQRLTTMQLRYPKFIHSEFMTHRMFSRNASSSRAIPVERLIKDVIDDPVYPSHWGANQKGMQADNECVSPVEVFDWGGGDAGSAGPSRTREEAWELARWNAVCAARAFTEAGYHKQIVNRLLETFCHINVVVTATQWKNFYGLRIHKDAQPEIRILAEAMLHAQNESLPKLLKPGEWHVPYVNASEKFRLDTMTQIKCSVARCARVSYLTQEGAEPKVEQDIQLYDKLVGSKPLHASPAEHQATPRDRDGNNIKEALAALDWQSEHAPQRSNLQGWFQYRKALPMECIG